MFVDRPAAAVELFRPTLKLDELDHPGLVEVDQPAPFRFGGVRSALEPGELVGEQLVVGSGARELTALSPARSTSGRSRAWQTWSNTKA